MMITAKNKSDIYELLKVIWTHPSYIELNKMITKDREEAKLPNKYNKGLVTDHIRKEVLRRRKKECIRVVYWLDDADKFLYIRAEYVKKHFDLLAPYIDMVEEGPEIYRITQEHAEDFVEDVVLKTTCGDDHMKITAIYDRFVTVNPETKAGYNRHSMLIVTGYDMQNELHTVHNEIKAMNKFKPFSKSEIVYATLVDDIDDVRDVRMFKCDNEKELRFDSREEYKEAYPESDRDLNKLLKRSVCYFA